MCDSSPVVFCVLQLFQKSDQKKKILHGTWLCFAIRCAWLTKKVLSARVIETAPRSEVRARSIVESTTPLFQRGLALIGMRKLPIPLMNKLKL